jgi:hypothetical protein
MAKVSLQPAKGRDFTRPASSPRGFERVALVPPPPPPLHFGMIHTYQCLKIRSRSQTLAVYLVSED